MKKTASKKRPNLDKTLIEAGLLCRKRLHLDVNDPLEPQLSATRRTLSQVGLQLVEIAQSVFPKGIAIGGATAAAAADETAQLLEQGTPVLFGATFIGDGIEVVSDILVRHKDGAIDLYEVKSGTKVKQRYLVDLALQAHVLAAAGHELRAAFLLNLNSKYVHKEDADYPPMQLLRSTDVTAKVQKQLPHLRKRLVGLRDAVTDKKTLDFRMGSFCVQPMRCPRQATCSKGATDVPVYGLPELSREQEAALVTDGTAAMNEVDPERPGLTFAQRRAIECVRTGEPIIEPFIAEELQRCKFPLHFLAIATTTDPLPRFDGQRPWRRVPYAWAATTLYDDGRIESATFAHAERSDPRLAFATGLGQHVGNGGTVLCWNADSIEGLRSLLEDLPAAKVAVRAVIGRSQVDLMQLFEAGVFHPDLFRRASAGQQDLMATAKALLGDDSGRKLAVRDEDSLRELLDKAWAPRVRATTREKIAGEIRDSLTWQSQQLLALFRKFGGGVEKKREGVVRKAGPAKALPKLPE